MTLQFEINRYAGIDQILRRCAHARIVAADNHRAGDQIARQRCRRNLFVIGADVAHPGAEHDFAEIGRRGVFAIQRTAEFGGVDQIVGRIVKRHDGPARDAANDVIAEMRVGIGQCRGKLEPRSRTQGCVSFDTLDQRAACNVAGDRLVAGCARTGDRLVLLHVLVVGHKARKVQLQHTIGQIELATDFIAVDGFGLERGVGAGGVTRTRAEPARTIAASPAGIEHGIAVWPVIDADFGGEFREAGLTRGEWRTLETVVENLFVMGPAATKAQAEMIGKGPVEVAEAGIAARRGIFDLIARCSLRRVSRSAQRITATNRRILHEIIIRMEEVCTDDIVKTRSNFPSAAQFLTPLCVLLVTQHIIEAGGGKVLRLGFIAVAPAGDRSQLHVAQIFIHRQRRVGRMIMAERLRVGHLIEIRRHRGDAIEGFARLGQADVDRDKRLDDIFDRQRCIKARTHRLVQQGRAEAVILAAAGACFQRGVVVITIGLVVVVPCLHAEIGTIAQIDQRLAVPGVPLAIGKFDFAAGLHGGCGALDADHAADRVGAEQRTLWSAQHFDLGDVEHVLQLAGVGTERNAINHHANGRGLRLFDVGVSHAANGQVGGLRTRILLRDQQAGGCALQVADVGRSLGFQHPGVDRGDRDRGGLQRFTAATRRNDDGVGIDSGRRSSRRGWGGGIFGERHARNGQARTRKKRSNSASENQAIHRSSSQWNVRRVDPFLACKLPTPGPIHLLRQIIGDCASTCAMLVA